MFKIYLFNFVISITLIFSSFVKADSVSLGACKHILELSGYSAEQNINIRTNTQKDLDKMTDEELYMKLIEFTKDLNMPFEVIEKKKLLS